MARKKAKPQNKNFSSVLVDEGELARALNHAYSCGKNDMSFRVWREEFGKIFAYLRAYNDAQQKKPF